MNEGSTSAQACPVCGQHRLAIDAPPRIDVMGVQPYSDLLGMGDLPQEGHVGIVCLACGTRWADRKALERGEPEPPDAEVAGSDDGSPDDGGLEVFDPFGDVGEDDEAAPRRR